MLSPSDQVNGPKPLKVQLTFLFARVYAFNRCLRNPLLCISVIQQTFQSRVFQLAALDTSGNFQGDCPVHCRMFSVPWPCPWMPEAFPSCDSSVSRHCQMFSGKQNFSWLRTSVLDPSVSALGVGIEDKFIMQWVQNR